MDYFYDLAACLPRVQALERLRGRVPSPLVRQTQRLVHRRGVVALVVQQGVVRVNAVVVLELALPLPRTRGEATSAIVTAIAVKRDRLQRGLVRHTEYF